MPSDGDSFLPRIQSVFYAVFDSRQGPKIVYQLPEGLIAVPPAGPATLSTSSSPVASTPSPSVELETVISRNSSSSLVSPTSQRQNSRSLHSPQKRSSSANRILFNFDDISKYVIPHSALCGRLVTCATKRNKIIGFPVELRGDYERNYFRYNLCFVFERTADLSCYEPIVRKVSRVLTACEEESSFLSSPDKSPALYAILEQLYEDLNSYSETSIPVDKFNSIELKIFPFYPNPPPVRDWMVPLALINLITRIEPNWDLTMAKVCKFIDGTNHVSRIAHLADCDLELTRDAISHLLHYQVIMIVDIFQYSNMYTLRKSVQWLADEAHVKEQCGPYVTKPGRPIPDWPKLLHLYSRLKPGKTVWEWMEEYDVNEFGIDVRRFTSFGVIKGFLRRVHRWPVLLQDKDTNSQIPSSPAERPGTSSFGMSPTSFVFTEPTQVFRLEQRRFRSQIPDMTPSITMIGSEPTPNGDGAEKQPVIHSARKTSAAERILEQIRRRSASPAHPPTAPMRTVEEKEARRPGGQSENRRHSLVSSLSSFTGPLSALNNTSKPTAPTPPSPILARARSSQTIPAFVSNTSSQTPTTAVPISAAMPTYPSDLPGLLDGEHHTDELCTRFEVGWSLLEQWLVSVGSGKGNGDFGRVAIIYR